jgi:hypothetical protein
VATLADLPVGSVFAFATRITDRTDTSMTLDLLSQDDTVQATISTDAAGVITGSLLKPPEDIPVEAVTRPLVEGAVVSKDGTGETMVVRAVWLSPRGFAWSSSPDRRVTYTTTGWTVVGQATLST